MIGRHGRLSGCTLLVAAVLRVGAAGAAGTVPPYLDSALLPSGAAILPPPPPPGSTAATLDGQVYLDTRAMRQQDPGRWALAARDSSLDGERLPAAFACALGMSPDRAATPGLSRLLRRTARTIAQPVRDAQQHFHRRRPFLHNHQPICLPRFTSLDHSPSYPSADAALGWSAALILAELAPERSAAILARGRELGEDRIVCGVEWLSDVQAATLDAASMLAVLHADPGFTADVRQARQELRAARGSAAARPDTAVCAPEQAALSHPLPSQP